MIVNADVDVYANQNPKIPRKTNNNNNLLKSRKMLYIKI